ncbi:MAG: F0F1 ATP synthase subunit epsilon, partial [Oleispira antarctica]|nr:F0F1 ATP synthase subunit epsilon [Oleispira antarctica]MBQ0791647.1 F0F1 ATP synthase subunit epsilon [Oleispira antarctica]
MPAAHMTLKVLLPYKVFAEEHNVVRIVAMTHQGAFGILPNRLDCVASLS